MLVIKKFKKLLLNLKNPDRITAVMPTAKTLVVKGKTLVAIPHKIEEVRVLRNLGFDAPAPMGSYYDWPGLYKPFIHQQVTGEFLTLNPRAFVLNGMGCISGDETVRVSRKGKSYETTLRELHQKFHKLPDKGSWKVRSLMGDRFGMNKLLDSLYKGEQSTLRFTLADGKTFRCTPDHRIARPDGTWTEAGDLSVGDTLVTNGTVAVACPQCGVVVVLPKQSEIVSIEDGGVTDVYDLCMKAPHHNFVVNGVVVHNSGKTMSVLWAFDYLRKLGVLKRMLVISPLSTLERAWGDEIFRHFPDMSFAVLHGTREKRHKLLACDFDVYIINHDGIKSKETIELLRQREGLDLVVVDEIASFRNASTERFKALNLLINGDKKTGEFRKEWAWGLTGTPTPNAPTDAWAQVKLINPGKAPGYFGAFRDLVMRQSGPYKWIMREGALEVVKNMMLPAVRFSREECIDLPPTTYVTRQTELTPEQKRAFDDMLRQLKAEHGGGQITAVNEAVKLSKLIQICCGCAYGTEGDVLLPNSPRVELVREIIEEAEAKVLVFVPLTGALKVLTEELRRDFTVEMVHGETSKAERDRIFKDFQSSKDPRVIVANPGTLSHGLTLTAANTIIWFAPINSNETYQQANARVTRPGQTLNTLIVHVEATPLERKIYDRLQGKEKTQGILLDLLKGVK